MKLKTTLVAAILAVAPTFALAMGCNWEHTTQEAMSCAEGMVWDAASSTCVEQITS